ncbi:MAG: hypothetical protein Q8903_01680, partial [Bacteroidota bacterium]|nr:hypothetical protein [Bacteroidota bacterium]
ATPYGQKILQKVITYRQEKERVKKAVEDSIKAIEQKRTDSLALIQKRVDSLKTVGQKKIDTTKTINNGGTLKVDSTKTSKVLTKDELLIDSVKNSRLKLKNKIDEIKKGSSGDSIKTDIPGPGVTDSTINKDSIKVQTNPPLGDTGKDKKTENDKPKDQVQGVQEPPNTPPNSRGKRK